MRPRDRHRPDIHQVTLTFGTFFFDYDLDGLPDLLAVNGHVSDDVSVVQPTLKYAQPPLLFHNLGKGKFEEVTARMGPALTRAIVGRGAAYGDFDNDGDLDLVIMANGGNARLLRNDNANQNDMLRVKTVGTRSNRDGIGAKITVNTSKSTRLFGMVKTGSSYLSQSELPLTFGLGKPEEGRKVSLTVVWPSGQKDSFANIEPNQFITHSRRKEGSSLPAQSCSRRPGRKPRHNRQSHAPLHTEVPVGPFGFLIPGSMLSWCHLHGHPPAAF